MTSLDTERDPIEVSDICVVEILRGSKQYDSAVSQIRADKSIWDESGFSHAIAALTVSERCRLLVAYSIWRPIGAASFRHSHRLIKRIETGVITRGVGIGTELVKKMIELTGCRRMWCHSVPAANAWCESLGMKRIGTRADGVPRYAGTVKLPDGH